jgi:hypothetical protein
MGSMLSKGVSMKNIYLSTLGERCEETISVKFAESDFFDLIVKQEKQEVTHEEINAVERRVYSTTFKAEHASARAVKDFLDKAVDLSEVDSMTHFELKDLVKNLVTANDYGLVSLGELEFQLKTKSYEVTDEDSNEVYEYMIFANLENDSLEKVEI